MGNEGSSSSDRSDSDSGNFTVSSSGSSNVSLSSGGSVSLGSGSDRSDYKSSDAYDGSTAKSYGEACKMGAASAYNTFVDKDMGSDSNPMDNNIGTDIIERSAAAVGGCLGAVARKAFSD